MRMFDVYYSGIITIEAESRKEAIEEFYRKYSDYGDIEDIMEDYED